MSTTADMNRFMKALMNGTLVSRATVNLFTAPKPELNSSSYGYGFTSRAMAGKRRIGHSGGYVGHDPQHRGSDGAPGSIQCQCQ